MYCPAPGLGTSWIAVPVVFMLIKELNEKEPLALRTGDAPAPVFVMVMDPAPLLTEMPLPAVIVAGTAGSCVPCPMYNCPFARPDCPTDMLVVVTLSDTRFRHVALPGVGKGPLDKSSVRDINPICTLFYYGNLTGSQGCTAPLLRRRR
jgi:hypothetical protein